MGRPHAVAVELSQAIQEGRLELRSKAGELLSTSALSPRPGSDAVPKNDGHYSATVTPPAVPFIAFVTGKTLAGEPFERSQMVVTQAQYVAMTVPAQQPVRPGEQAQYEFVLHNHGAADTFAVRVTDDAGFVVGSKELELALAAGETARLVVTAKVPLAAKLGTESTIHVDVASVSNRALATYGSVALEVDEELDQDGDNVLNAQDNCATLSNPDQLDYDKDGLGNACDATPGEPPSDAGCSATQRSGSRGALWIAGALGLACLLRSLKKRTRARAKQP